MQITHTAPASPAAPPHGFTGPVLADEIAMLDGSHPVHVYTAHFPPGARTIWHRRGRGQVLYVTSGAGLVQRRDGRVEEIHAGDTIRIPPGEWTWFGAQATTPMTHLSIKEGDGRDSELGAPVTDAEYAAR
jgi:quercetin dioxygenase-like cupin family protein